MSDGTKSNQTMPNDTQSNQTMSDPAKSSTWRRRFKKPIKCTLAFLSKFLCDWSLSFAAMLAYYLLVAIVPTAVAIFGIIGLIIRNDPVAQLKLVNQLVFAASGGNHSKGPTDQVVNLAMDQLANEAGSLLALGIIVAIFGASRLFAAIERVFTIIFRFPERTFLARNLLAMVMVSVYIVLFLLMIVTTSSPSVLVQGVESAGVRLGVYSAGIASSVLVAFVLFEFIYWIVPNKKMSLKTTWVGSLFSACTLEIILMWFPLYVQKNMDTYTGVVGFVLLFIGLLYYFNIVLILGAQINAFCTEHYVSFGKGMGTCLSEMYHERIESGSRQPLLDENANSKKPSANENTDSVISLIDKNADSENPSVDKSADTVPLQYEKLN